MLASSMFAKFKSTPVVVHNPWDNNPITEFFDIGKEVASCGPEHVWKIHDGHRKSDVKVSEICYYDLRYSRPKVLLSLVFDLTGSLVEFSSPLADFYHIISLIKLQLDTDNMQAARRTKEATFFVFRNLFNWVEYWKTSSLFIFKMFFLMK